MKSGISANQLWTQTPVAARLVEVNTKTGFSLTAGSYSVRESAAQRGSITTSGATSVTATISSSTMTHSLLTNGGPRTTVSDGDNAKSSVGLELTNATTITAYKGDATGAAYTEYAVIEFF
jgi:hypothetical protein